MISPGVIFYIVAPATKPYHILYRGIIHTTATELIISLDKG